MARLMKNWLGNYVTEELKLAIQWKRRTFVKKHIKAEPVDDYNFFKHEPLENPDLSVPPVTPRTYEDDGSNLRAKLSRTVDVQSVLQITGFVNYENPVQAILSDSYTCVRATFTSAAIEKFTNKEKRRITDRTRGGVINIYDFELVATSHGPAHEHVSLLITNFVYLGGNSPQFGDPKPIEDDGNMRELLQELSIIWRDEATHSEDKAYLANQVGSQDAEPVADSQLGLSSQMQLATQLPGMTMLASPRVKMAQSGNNRPNRMRADQITDRRSFANDPGATVTDASNLLKLLHLRPPKNASTSRQDDAKSMQLALPTRNVAEPREEFRYPKSPTTFNAQRSSTDRSPSLPLGDGRAPSDLNVGGQATAMSAASSEDVHPSPKQSSATREDTSDPVLPQNSRSKASIKTTLSIGDQISRHGSVMTLSQLDRSLLAIPSDQRKIIDRLESWLPSEPGSRFPLANIPVTTLQSLQDLNEELTEKDVTSPGIGVGVVKPLNCDKRSEECADTVLTGMSRSSSDSHSDSDDSPYEWGSSPSRIPQEVLPPDSSAVAPQSVKRTPNRGMFSRPPLTKPPEYSGFETDSSSSDSDTHNGPVQRPPTNAGESADDDLMEIDRPPSFNLASGRKRGSQLSTPMHGPSSQNSNAASRRTSPVIRGRIARNRPSSNTSPGPKSASKRRYITTADVEMTGVTDGVDQGDGSSASVISPQTTDISPSPARSQQEQRVQVAETPGSRASPRHPIAGTGLRARKSDEGRPRGITLQHQERGTHDLRSSTSIIPATLESPRQAQKKSPPKPQPEVDAINGEQTVRESYRQSPHVQEHVKTVSKTVDTSSPELVSDIGSRSSGTQTSRPSLSALAKGRSPNIESTTSPILESNQAKRKVEEPLSGNATKRIKKNREPDLFGFSQEELPPQDPRRTGREARREFFRQERLSKHNNDTRADHKRSPLTRSQHPANPSVKGSEQPTAIDGVASARDQRACQKGLELGPADSSRATQGSREVALERDPNNPINATATLTGSEPVLVHGNARPLNRNSGAEGNLQVKPAKLTREVPSSSLIKLGQWDGDFDRMPGRPRESDIKAETRLSFTTSRPSSYFAAPKQSVIRIPSVDSPPATPQQRPKSREAQDNQASLQRPASIGQDEAARLSAQHPAGRHIPIFEQFTQTYPQYKGDVTHFGGLCRMIKKLQVEDKMVHPSLWNDFIIRHKLNYQPYVLRCSAAGEDPIPFLKFYNNEVEAPKFLKRVLTPKTIDIALSELGRSSEPTEKAPSLLASTQKLNSKPASKPAQARVPLGPSSAALSTAQSLESRTDVDAGRPISTLDRSSTDRNRQDVESRDARTPTRPRFAVDSYRPVYASTPNSIQYRPNDSKPASSSHPNPSQPASSSHPHRSLPWSTNAQNESKLPQSSDATPTPTPARRAHSAQTSTTPLIIDGESNTHVHAEKHAMRTDTATAAKMGKTPITDRILGSDGKPRRWSSAVPRKRAASSVMEDDDRRQHSGPPISASATGETEITASSTVSCSDAAAAAPAMPIQPPSPSNKPTETNSSTMQCGQEEQQDVEASTSLAVFLRNYKRLRILDGVLGPPDDDDGVGSRVVSDGARMAYQHEQEKLDVLGWCL